MKDTVLFIERICRLLGKFSGEQFPRYIKYTRDGDDYELEFDEFVK